MGLPGNEASRLPDVSDQLRSGVDVSVETSERAVRGRRRIGMREMTWLGAVLCAAGFAVITLGWAKVAAENQVHLQLPYVVSAGLTGLGILMLGLTMLNLAATERDAIARERDIGRLVRTIEVLHGPDDRGDGQA